MDKEDIFWIDAVKCICMFSVYLIHSKAYYGFVGTDYAYVLRPFYINAFIFVSGYLFFKKSIPKTSNGKSTIVLSKKLENILYRLILPTIIFSTIIYLPKIFFHGNETNLQTYFFQVWGGLSFWFTSALTITQIAIIFLCFIRFRNIWHFTIITFIIFIIAVKYNNSQQAYDISDHFPWFYKTGLAYTFLFTLGGVYEKYENLIDRHKKWWLPILFFVYLYFIISNFNMPKLKMLGMSGNCNISGFFCLLSSIMIIIFLTKKLKSNSIIKFIGRQSIVFYFFSGVYPAAIGALALKFFPEKNYLITICVSIIAIICGYITTYIIKKYLPFLIDIRKLKRQP